MNAFKLIILLVTLPILFILPFLMASEKPLEDVVPEDAVAVPSDMMGTKEFLEKRKNQNTNVSVASQAAQLGTAYVQKMFKKPDADKAEIGKMRYMVAVPTKPWPEGVKFPLIIHFSDKKNVAPYSGKYFLEDAIAYDFPAVNVAPLLDANFIWASYKQTDMKQVVDVLMDVIQSIITDFPIVDTNRIYLVGCGHGAEGVFGAIERYPGVFAAAMAHSGGWNVNKGKYLTNTPIYSVTGKNNEAYSPIIMRELAKNIKQNGGNIIFKEMPNVKHECGSSGYYSSKALSWMFSQRR